MAQPGLRDRTLAVDSALLASLASVYKATGAQLATGLLFGTETRTPQSTAVRLIHSSVCRLDQPAWFDQRLKHEQQAFGDNLVFQGIYIIGNVDLNYVAQALTFVIQRATTLDDFPFANLVAVHLQVSPSASFTLNCYAIPRGSGTLQQVMHTLSFPSKEIESFLDSEKDEYEAEIHRSDAAASVLAGSPEYPIERTPELCVAVRAALAASSVVHATRERHASQIVAHFAAARKHIRTIVNFLSLPLTGAPTMQQLWTLDNVSMAVKVLYAYMSGPRLPISLIPADSRLRPADRLSDLRRYENMLFVVGNMMRQSSLPIREAGALLLCAMVELDPSPQNIARDYNLESGDLQALFLNLQLRESLSQVTSIGRLFLTLSQYVTQAAECVVLGPFWRFMLTKDCLITYGHTAVHRSLRAFVAKTSSADASIVDFLVGELSPTGASNAEDPDAVLDIGNTPVFEALKTALVLVRSHAYAIAPVMIQQGLLPRIEALLPLLSGPLQDVAWDILAALVSGAGMHQSRLVDHLLSQPLMEPETWSPRFLAFLRTPALLTKYVGMLSTTRLRLRLVPLLARFKSAVVADDSDGYAFIHQTTALVCELSQLVVIQRHVFLPQMATTAIPLAGHSETIHPLVEYLLSPPVFTLISEACAVTIGRLGSSPYVRETLRLIAETVDILTEICYVLNADPLVVSFVAVGADSGLRSIAAMVRNRFSVIEADRGSVTEEVTVLQQPYRDLFFQRDEDRLARAQFSLEFHVELPGGGSSQGRPVQTTYVPFAQMRAQIATVLGYHSSKHMEIHVMETYRGSGRRYVRVCDARHWRRLLLSSLAHRDERGVYIASVLVKVRPSAEEKWYDDTEFSDYFTPKAVPIWQALQQVAPFGFAADIAMDLDMEASKTQAVLRGLRLQVFGGSDKVPVADFPRLLSMFVVLFNAFAELKVDMALLGTAADLDGDGHVDFIEAAYLVIALSSTNLCTRAAALFRMFDRRKCGTWDIEDILECLRAFARREYGYLSLSAVDHVKQQLVETLALQTREQQVSFADAMMLCRLAPTLAGRLFVKLEVKEV